MTAPRARCSVRGSGVRRTVALALLVTALLTPALLAPVPTATAAPDQDPPVDDSPVTVRVDAMTPRVVTADGPPELLVTGVVTNRGSTSIGDLAVRVQRGTAVTGERDTVAALEGDETGGQVRPGFAPVTGVLDPGDEVGFTVRLPLQGPSTTSLGLTEPGVYPLLVNVNGREGTAGATRLGAVRLLLPVLDLPGDRPGRPGADGPATVGVLYPIADVPRRVPVLPGEGPLLTDDTLAGSMAPGGRLAGLLDALARAAPPGSPAAASLCLAVDADLLETARVMAGGYEVATPTGRAPGRGAEAARAWLDGLRAQSAGRCVIALPYADTDVLATSRGNLTDLTTAARTTGARRTADLLGAPPAPDTTMPADGDVDERTLADLVTGGARTLMVDADVLDEPPRGGVTRLTGPAGSSAVAVATDPIAAAALAPRSPSSEGATSPAGTAEPLAAQDAIGALVLRAREAVGARGDAPVSVVAPPRAWAVGAAEAQAYLDTVTDLTGRGVVRPVDVGRLAAAATARPGGLPSTSLVDRRADDSPELAADVVQRARVVRDRQRDLLAASERDRIGAPSPSDLLDPLSEGLMRSLSATRRGDVAAQGAALAGVEGQMDALAGRVRVVQPSGVYSLGSNEAPLLLSVENRLPVAVRVQVVLAPTPGLTTRPLPVVSVPADGSRQFSIDVDVIRSGQFAVDAQAETPGGEPLGPPARLLLRSTAYGTITVWLTASAAVVLVVLASVQIVRRVRTARRERRAHRGRRRRPEGPTGPHGPTEPPTRELQNR